MLFRFKDSGKVVNLPDHYANHPVIGKRIEVYSPDDFEEDKVVVAGHELPVDQRAVIMAEPVIELDEWEEASDDKESD